MLGNSELLAEVKHFLGGVEMRLQLLRHVRQELDAQLASDFSVFRYLCPDELKLSDLISDLLSPQGDHGQGNTFLSLFLELIECPTPAGCASVVREDCTRYCKSFRRRIDITLDFGSFGVGIENKPFANESDDQIADYSDHLDRKYGGNYLLVFLSDDGRQPQSLSAEQLNSLKRSSKLVVLSYSKLREWLQNCWKECRAERVRWFLQDFQNWIGQEFPIGIEGER